MSHRGPRQQRFPSVNGVSANRNDGRRRRGGRVNYGPRPVTAPSVQHVYSLLWHSVGQPRTIYRKIRDSYPLDKYPVEVLMEAFREAREIDASYTDTDELPLAEGASFFEIRDAMLQIAYYNVRDIADRLMREQAS